MDKTDQERFLQNVGWFNQFFDDLRLLFEKIAKALSNEFTPPEQNGYYYPKSNAQPSIPAYYLTGMGWKPFAVQVFAILDPTLLENNPNFEFKPSLIVLKHSRGDGYLWVQDLGLQVIRNDQIELTERDGGVISGKTKGNEPTSFHAFQILFNEFTRGQDVEQVIQEAVVEVMRELRDW
jgi:hypothetical protein